MANAGEVSERLVGERVFLRELQESDASEEYCSWINDSDVNKYLEAKKTTVEELREYIKEKKESKNAIFYGIFMKETEKHIGNIKLEPIDWDKKKAMMGIMLGDKESWGLGLGKEAIELLLEHVKKEHSLKEIELGVRSEHTRAIALYKKLGFAESNIFMKKEL